MASTKKRDPLSKSSELAQEPVADLCDGGRAAVEPPDARSQLYLAALRTVFWMFVAGFIAIFGRMVWPLASVIGAILAPFGAGLVIAYIFHPIVRLLERRLHIGRAMGIVTVAGLILITLTLFSVILAPILYNQTAESLAGISKYLSQIDVNRHPVFSKLPADAREGIKEFIEGENVVESFGGFLSQAATHLFGSGEETQTVVADPKRDDAAADKKPVKPEEEKKAGEAKKPDSEKKAGEEKKVAAATPPATESTESTGGPPPNESDHAAHPAPPELRAADKLTTAYDFVRATIGTTISLAGWIGGSVANVVLTLIVAFYFLLEMSSIPSVIRKLLPVPHRDLTWKILLRANNDVGGYLRGQLTACAGVGLLAMLLVFIIGPRQYAVLIGFVAGLLNLIPYLGPASGALPALMYALLSPSLELWGEGGITDPVTLSDRGFQILLVIGGFSLIQAIDGFVFQPFIVGRQSALHPLAVMLALATGAHMGFVWMILAVPMACVVKVIFSELYWKKREDFIEVCPVPAPRRRFWLWGKRPPTA